MIKHTLKIWIELSVQNCNFLFLVINSIVLLENLFYNVLGKIQKIRYIYYQRVNLHMLQDNGNRVNHWNHCETKQAKDG